MFDQPLHGGLVRHFKLSVRTIVWLLLALLTLVPPALAQSGNPSGLPLPRFASTRSDPINVRVGPGTKYEVSWTYLKSVIPVEIIQEFDTWRKIRDVDGAEGWVHQNLLQGTRAGYAAPLMANGEVVLRADQSDSATTRARLGAGFKVIIKQCDGVWCDVTATSQDPSKRSTSYSGYVRQEELWGVYPDEQFD
ncbi:SH3 domain-containing protein [Devosia sp. J2-20]|uniref:SH3 domain-containing protein n=1 Tax=Devosia sp. J2-20 TaxID=3026161 RepID=UPI00249C89A4|nr:SH3 domain-containing protein [Devosia sp. J2-20]WDR00306.1 SH3 domain-containing protein [Devosia sp. J2-20]